jgi:hypothetical protein
MKLWRWCSSIVHHTFGEKHMRNWLLAILGICLLGLPVSSVLAGDGDKPEKSKPAEKEKVKEKDKSDEVSDNDDHRGGNSFTRFWTHTVGGSIGHGLKHGSHKVAKAFGSDD